MAAFVIVLTDKPDDIDKALKKMAKDHKITNTPLTVFEGVKGPPNYKLSSDADVTVIMWEGRDVKVNHAFAANALNKEAIAKVVADAAKFAGS